MKPRFVVALILASSLMTGALVSASPAAAASSWKLHISTVHGTDSDDETVASTRIHINAPVYIPDYDDYESTYYFGYMEIVDSSGRDLDATISDAFDPLDPDDGDSTYDFYNDGVLEKGTYYAHAAYSEDSRWDCDVTYEEVCIWLDGEDIDKYYTIHWNGKKATVSPGKEPKATATLAIGAKGSKKVVKSTVRLPAILSHSSKAAVQVKKPGATKWVTVKRFKLRAGKQSLETSVKYPRGTQYRIHLKYDKYFDAYSTVRTK